MGDVTVRKILSFGEEIASLGNAHIIKNKKEDTFYLVIPFGSTEITNAGKRLLNFLPRKDDRSAKSITFSEQTVASFLSDIGIPENVRGFYYLRTAVMTAVNEEDKEHVSGHIYSILTSEYNTSVSKIERNIRYAVSVAFDRGDPSLLSEVFGSSYSSDTGRPTNLDAIYSICSALKKRADV